MVVKIHLEALWQELGASKEFCFCLAELASLEELTLIEPLFVRGKIVNQGSFLELMISLQTKLLLVCSRCLDEVNYPLKIEIKERYYLEKPLTSDEQAFAAPQWLDLKALAQENIILNIPMRILCQPDCPGLCPQCGINLKLAKCACQVETGDPRLAVLAQLKK